MALNYSHVVAVPGARHCVDFINPETGRTFINGDTPEQCAQRHPGAVMMPVAQYEAQQMAHRESLMTDPEEIDADRWWYLLEVLPPLDWRGGLGTESFKMSEFQTMDLTTCAVRVGSRYFTALRPVATTHEQLVALVCSLFKLSPA
jgi:hypothetical protein